MLEKAKNRKIFYFFVFIVLGISLFISPVFAVCNESTINFTVKSVGETYIKPDLYSSGFTEHSLIGYRVLFTSGLESGYYFDIIDNTEDAIIISNEKSVLYKFSELNNSLPTGIVYQNPGDNDYQFRIHYTKANNGWVGLSSVPANVLNLNFYATGNKTNWMSGIFGTNFGSCAGPPYYAIGQRVKYTGDLCIESSGKTPADKGETLKVYPASAITGLCILYEYFTVVYSEIDLDDIEIGDGFKIFDAVNNTFVCENGIISSEYSAIINLDVSSGDLPLDVTFTDNSTGWRETYPYPTYVIYFGDGTSFAGERQYSGEQWFHEYNSEGIFNITYLISDGIHTDIDYDFIKVTDNSKNYEVIVSGLDTQPISGANVSIWFDGSYQESEGTSEAGVSYFIVPANRFVNGTVTKPGYQTAYFDTYINTGLDNFELVTLYTDDETPGIGDSYGNYIVSFKDASNGASVGYSNIEVYSDSGYTTLFYDEYSNSNGVWTGLLPMNVIYYYKYPETIGYYSQSWSYNLTSSPAYKIVNLVPKSAATSTTTLTPTTTTTTIIPTVTYTYNDSNLSTLNVKERITNLLVLAGFQNAESADLIFAMIIVLGCTALIGWITLSGSGAGMGAIIGFVFSLGLGLIPLWLLISAVFLGCLYLALKLFGETGE